METKGRVGSPLDIRFYGKGEISSGFGDGNGKWQGGVGARMDVKAGKVWEVVEDFCGMQKWAPTLEESKHVEGELNAP
eukprot:c46425_g1_i1 orf=223-456(+)